MVAIGDPAPPFDVVGVSPAGEIRRYTLAELAADGALVICVYDHDFAPTSTSRLCRLAESDWLASTDRVSAVGLGGDGPYAHRHFGEETDLQFPLLSDADRSVCADYDVRTERSDGSTGVPRHSLFLVDPDHRIRYKWVADSETDEAPLSDLATCVDRLRGGPVECSNCNERDGTLVRLEIATDRQPNELELALCDRCATELQAEDWITVADVQ